MQYFCLVCFNPIIPKMGWYDLISEEKEQVICQTCKNQFQPIIGPTCRICNRPIDQLEASFIKQDLCYDCYRWEEDPIYKGCLRQNQSLYVYNPFLQDLLARYKFRGDYILAKLFSEELRLKMSKKDKKDIITPIPLSLERLLERGFNQAEALIKEAGLTSTELLTRIHTEKQSKKSRHDRIHAKQIFQLNKPSITGKSILLIDDIYTTGSTLRHAAKLLIENGAKSVESITIARG